MCLEYEAFLMLLCPGDQHVVEVASMALDLLASSVVFQIPHRPSAKLNIRMGIHRLAESQSHCLTQCFISGPATGVVVGTKETCQK